MDEFEPTTHQKEPVQESLFPTSEIEYWHHYEILTTPEGGEKLRQQYAQLTDKLIYSIQKEKPKHLIFLDKSARPVAWMLKELWPIMASDENGEVDEMPSINFLNIDREQWRVYVKDDDSGMIDVSRLPRETFEDLRSIFTDKVTSKKDTFPERSKFDNEKIMLIDEVRVTGDTLEIASDMLKEAFPNSEVITNWWMIPEVKSKPGQPPRNNNIPIWYSDENVKGRGVGNRDDSKSSASPSARQRRGKQFLSTRFREIDTKALQLREEIKHMARDIMEGRLVVRPDGQRDDWEQQFERINQISWEDYKEKRS